MTVFVTQDVQIRVAGGDKERKFDLRPAERFGDIKILLSAGQSAVSTVPVVRQLKELLRDFNEKDYLILLGDPSIMAAASMIAGERNQGRVKILKWDRRMADYIPIQIDSSGKEL